MTEIQFLAQFILDEKIPLEIRQKFLDRVTELQNVVPFPGPQGTLPWTITQAQVCLHEYPFPWHSVTPPHCKKCGQMASFPFITSSVYVRDVLVGAGDLGSDLIGGKC